MSAPDNDPNKPNVCKRFTGFVAKNAFKTLIGLTVTALLTGQFAQIPCRSFPSATSMSDSLYKGLALNGASRLPNNKNVIVMPQVEHNGYWIETRIEPYSLKAFNATFSVKNAILSDKFPHRYSDIDVGLSGGASFKVFRAKRKPPVANLIATVCPDSAVADAKTILDEGTLKFYEFIDEMSSKDWLETNK